MLRKTVLASLVVLVSAAATFAQEHAGAPADGSPHPIISHESSWAGVMLIIILGMFLTAGMIGFILNLMGLDQLPVAHSHDEPPGASGHHGKSGTVDRHDHH